MTNTEAGQVEAVIKKLPLSQPAELSLKCHIDPIRPFLDFSFHYEAGFLLSCPVRLFEGHKATIRSYLKVTPEMGAPVFFGSGYQIPEVPAELRERIRVSKVRVEVEGSGGFLLGEGRYRVEHFLIDDQGRYKLTRWRCNAQRSFGERKVRVAATAYTASPLSDQWRSAEQKPAGPGRVAVYVNASPLDPRQVKLRAWDRSFLVGSVASLLRSLPASSVQLVAFNLEQGREIYRESDFHPAGLEQLAQSMEKLELGVVSIHTLSRADGGARLLQSLLSNPSSSDQRDPETIIFLGPWTRSNTFVSKRSPFESNGGTRLHDIVYFFPSLRGDPTDTVQHLTKAMNGTVYRIHSPGELAEAIDKISSQLTKATVLH